MAGKFWFGKRNISENTKQNIGVIDNNLQGGAVVMAGAVFPTGFNDQDKDFLSDNSDLESVKKDVESVKKKIVEENKKAEISTPSTPNYGMRESTNKEIPVNSYGNKGGIKFSTRSIPGVIDGGKADGHPVLTPVRKSASGAPVKLKSISKKSEEISTNSRIELKKPTTSALKVINKEHKPGYAEDQPKFGLHLRQPSAKKVVNNVPAKIAAPDEYIKPKSDQRVLYYQLMNGLYDAVLVLDDDGHVVDCNDRVFKVLGFSREDAWGLPIEQVIKGMDKKMFAHLNKSLAENHHVLITARCYKSNGDSFKGEIGVSTLSLTRDNNVVFAIRNVDQRKSAMAELRKSASAFEVALVPAFACNLEGFFTAVNNSLMDSFGIPDEKAAKKVRFVDILPDAARAFAKSVTGEKMHEKIVVSTAEGQQVKVEIVLVPVMNGREIIGVAGSVLQL